MWALSVSLMTGLDSRDLGHGEKGDFPVLSEVTAAGSCPIHFLPPKEGLATSDFFDRVFTTPEWEAWAGNGGPDRLCGFSSLHPLSHNI